MLSTIDLPLVLSGDFIIAGVAEVVSYKWCGRVVATKVYLVQGRCGLFDPGSSVNLV